MTGEVGFDFNFQPFRTQVREYNLINTNDARTKIHRLVNSISSIAKKTFISVIFGAIPHAACMLVDVNVLSFRKKALTFIEI